MTFEGFADAGALPLLPVEDDHDTAGFFAAARRGQLALKFCRACDRLLHLPREACFACGSPESEWRAVPGSGRVHAWTVITHQVHPAFPVPYTVALIDLDGLESGARLLAHIRGEADLRVGQPMRVRFERDRNGTVLPNWAAAPLATQEVSA